MEGWQKLTESDAGREESGSRACGIFNDNHVSRVCFRFSTEPQWCEHTVWCSVEGLQEDILFTQIAFAHAKHSHDSKATALSIGFGSMLVTRGRTTRRARLRNAGVVTQEDKGNRARGKIS